VFDIAKSRGVCYQFKEKGGCDRGKNCHFLHEVVKAGEERSSKLEGCRNFKNTGTCKFGNNCKFSHEKIETENKMDQDDKNKVQVNLVKNFKIATESIGYSTKEVKRYPYESESEGEESNAVVLCDSIEKRGDKNVVELVWDTGSGVNLTTMTGVLSSVMNIGKEVSVKGLGGKKRVSKIGESEVLGMREVMLVEGDMPNIMSVSKEAKDNSTVYILDSVGGARINVTEEDVKLLREIIKRANAEDRVRGRAVVKNGLYVESFGVKKSVSKKDSYADVCKRKNG